VSAPDPVETLAASLRAGAWLDVAQQCTQRLADAPDPTKAYHALLARARVRLGDPAGAARAASRADPTQDLGALAQTEAALAGGRPGESRASLRARLDLRDHGDHPERDPAWRELALALSTALRAAGDPERAYGLALRALAGAEADLSTDPIDVELALLGVGWAGWGCGRAREASAAFERALDSLTRRGAAPVLRADALDGLGVCARVLGDPFVAVAHHEHAHDLWAAALGERSPTVAACLHRLAHARHRAGAFEPARATMADSVALTAEHLGEDHVDTWISRFELARYDIDCGDFADGFARMAHARERVAALLGPHHPVVAAMDRYL